MLDTMQTIRALLAETDANSLTGASARALANLIAEVECLIDDVAETAN